jgi:excisionase family DNA binding protein
MNLSHLQDRATISVSDAAVLLGISRNGAYEAARTGQLPTLRLGRRLLVPVPALLRMLDSEHDPGNGGKLD